jgi:hypothetical protein
MFDVKSVFASRTLWGLVITAAPTIAGWFGLPLTAADATAGVGHLQNAITAGMELVGWAMVLWGRMSAKTQLKLFG